MTDLWLLNIKSNYDKKKPKADGWTGQTLAKYRAVSFVFRIRSQEALRQLSGRRPENYKQSGPYKSIILYFNCSNWVHVFFFHCKFRIKYTGQNQEDEQHWNILSHQGMQVKSSNRNFIYQVLICETAIKKLFLAITSQNWKWHKDNHTDTIMHQHKFCNFPQKRICTTLPFKSWPLIYLCYKCNIDTVPYMFPWVTVYILRNY